MGFETYDITWHLHHLNIDIANAEEEAGSPTSDQITDVLKAVEEALFPHDEELRVLQRWASTGYVSTMRSNNGLGY